MKGSKPRVKITGSHKMTAVFGALSSDGRKLFRQYPCINAKSFLNYVRSLKRKFVHFVFFYDGAPWHRAKSVSDYFAANNDCIIPMRLPKCSPEFNAVEECWRQGKMQILGSIFPPTFDGLKRQVAEFYRTKKFNLDVIKYLCQ